ncbi:MAG: amino acid permease [Lachnospiraceae bacterium]|nr:amino acid permease [Lachnospiraceae bacterium]
MGNTVNGTNSANVSASGAASDIKPQVPSRYLSPLSVWALSFGCAAGWGAFVMPGTSFLPTAGTVGSLLGIIAGVLVMLVIGMNYHYLINRFSDSGGTLSFAIRSFGHDHGFISAWFLLIVYIAIIWANATALPLITRSVLGPMFQFGFHYSVFGYDVYLGEILLSMAVILMFGSLCTLGKKKAALVQIVFAILLLLGIVVCAVIVFVKNGSTGAASAPLFAGSGKAVPVQILMIIFMSPWLYVGFESVSNSASEYTFSNKKVIWILAASLVCIALAFILPLLMAARSGNLGASEGINGIPVLYAARLAMGNTGVIILSVAAAAAVITGLVGSYIAASRLMHSMSHEGLLPKWFGRLGDDQNPENALWFLLAISIVIPLLGRTFAGWVADAAAAGAAIVYAYTSGAAFKNAREEGDRKYCITGMTGLVCSLLFLLCFMFRSADAVPVPAYLILAVWSILGLGYFYYVLNKDSENRFGKSMTAWLGLLFLIIFTSVMWMKGAFISEKTGGALTWHSLLLLLFAAVSLLILYSIYTIMTERGKLMGLENVGNSDTISFESIKAELQPVKVDLVSMLNEANNMFSGQMKKMNIDFTIDTSSIVNPAVMLDVSCFYRVMFSLVGNACRYTPNGGTVTIRMSQQETEKSETGIYTLCVKDSGIGMSPEAVKRLSEAFESKQTGAFKRLAETDPGLAITGYIVNLLGGTMDMETAPGQGTAFYVMLHLPICNEEIIRENAVLEASATEDESENVELKALDTGDESDNEAQKASAADEEPENEEPKESATEDEPGYETPNDMAPEKIVSEETPMAYDDYYAQPEQHEVTITEDAPLSEELETAITEDVEQLDEPETEITRGAQQTEASMSEENDIQQETIEEAEKEAAEEVATKESADQSETPMAYDYYYMQAEEPESATNANIQSAETTAVEENDLQQDAVKENDLQQYYSEELTEAAIEETAEEETATEENAEQPETPMEYAEYLYQRGNGMISEAAEQSEEADMSQYSSIPGTVSESFDDSNTEEDTGVTAGEVVEVAEDAESPSETGAEKHTLEGIRLLMAEDMFINAENMMKLLKAKGIECDSAEDGQEAVEMFEESAPGSYAAILMDVRMPVMSGLLATRQIRDMDRADAKAIPIIALVTSSFEEDVNDSYAAGMNAHLYKPIQAEELYETLEELILSGS